MFKKKSSLLKYVEGQRCTMSEGQCGLGNIWVTVGTGTNYPDFDFIGDVLQV